MFALVKYQDGVKKIVPSSDIKHFDAERISYSKKYKIKWEQDYYDGVVVLVGDTETEVEQKALQKRHKITPFELCESADDTDSSITGKAEDKNNNQPKDYIKQLVARKIEKVQMNLDKFVKSRETGDTTEKKTNGGPLSSDITRTHRTKSNESAKLIEAKNRGSTDVSKKDVSSIKKFNSKDRKPVNGKGTQESKQRDQRSKVDISSVNPTSGKNIAASSNKNEETSNKKKILDVAVQKRAIENKIDSKQTASPSMAKKVDSKKPLISVTTLKNNGCDSCKKLEKKLQDEVSNLDRMNIQLKQALKDKDKMLVEATRLNMDLQSKVLDQFDELKLVVGDMKQRAQENLDKNQGVLPVGYRRLDKSMIHLGQDIWISIPQYDSISCLSDTSAKFVKNLAIAVFGTTTLKQSSVTGVVSNRLKNKNLNAVARPKLDATKLLAIKGALAFWLRTEKNVDEVSIDIEVTRVGSHISHKIFELLRKDKKFDNYLHANGLPEIAIAGTGDDVRSLLAANISEHSDSQSAANRSSDKSSDEENFDAGKKSDDSFIGDNEGVYAQESDNEKFEDSRDDEDNRKNGNGDEDETHSQNSEE